MPRVIQGIEYYTIPETIDLTHMNEKTLYRYIKEKRVSYTRFMDQYYIKNDSVQQLIESNHPKFELAITKWDIATDQWLSNMENLMKLKNWAISTYTLWGSMALPDYLAYWRYLIKPLWKRENKTNSPYPQKQWLIDHGFKGFVVAFNKRYLESSGITTLSTFFEYLKREEKKDLGY